MEPIATCHTPIGILYLGPIGQSLNKSPACDNQPQSVEDSCPVLTPSIQVNDQTDTSQVQCDNTFMPPAHVVQHCTTPPENILQQNKQQEEDAAAFHYQSQLRGLPHDTVMHREDVSSDGVFSIAPSEGQKPIPMLTDEHFE